MLDFSVAVVPLLVVALANFIGSWMYYSPVAPWFKAWVIAVGRDPAQTQMSEADKKAMPRLMAGAVVASLLLAYGLQVLIHSLRITDFFTGALAGGVVWLTFAVTHSLNTQFEGRKPILLVINNGLYFLSYVLFAGIIASWS